MKVAGIIGRVTVCEGDIIKIGTLKGTYIIVYDKDFKKCRAKYNQPNCEFGFAFENIKYPIKIVSNKEK